MKYCKYYPLTPATYECEHCETSLSDQAVNEGENNTHPSCFVCQNEVESLGAMYSAEPFWRRFQESFRYPLKTETLVFIVAMAFLNIAAVFLPLAIIWILILFGVFMKYCFSCLEKTAKGSLIPPNITTAYEGGIVLALKLIAILFIIGFSIVGVQLWLGTGMATLYGVIALCCCPAIIINFSLSESVIDAVNPLKIAYLISAIGLPYGLLLAIILIMSGSVGFINELISNDQSFISFGLQIAVSNYYTIVIFHLMGYMLFQYQGELGFIARQEEDDDETTQGRNAAERTLANIDIQVKEGRYDEALLLFQDALKKHIKNKALHDKCFEFLLATKNFSLIDDFAPLYFSFLSKNQAKDQLTLVYKKIMAIYPKYMPAAPEDRLLLAQECQASGDSLSALRLVNGMHQEFPNFGRLIPAMELMVEALKNLPNMSDKAEKFDLLVKRFKKKKEKERAKPKAPTKAALAPKLGDNLTLEEQIKENAKAESLAPNKARTPPKEAPPKQSNDIDYDGGIDFN
ncbi:MAG: hypothetical protein ACRBBR_14440 [Cellvibrionaceae bacterium]